MNYWKIEGTTFVSGLHKTLTQIFIKRRRRKARLMHAVCCHHTLPSISLFAPSESTTPCIASGSAGLGELTKSELVGLVHIAHKLDIYGNPELFAHATYAIKCCCSM